MLQTGDKGVSSYEKAAPGELEDPMARMSGPAGRILPGTAVPGSPEYGAELMRLQLVDIVSKYLDKDAAQIQRLIPDPNDSLWKTFFLDEKNLKVSALDNSAVKVSIDYPMYSGNKIGVSHDGDNSLSYYIPLALAAELAGQGVVSKSEILVSGRSIPDYAWVICEGRLEAILPNNAETLALLATLDLTRGRALVEMNNKPSEQELGRRP